MKLKNYLLGLIGATPGRQAPPPTYRTIADGLIITATKAEAWFEVQTSNTDLASDALLDDEIDSVIKVVGAALKDADCHLKIVWSNLSGDEYARTMSGTYTTGNYDEWVAMRADLIDAMALPDRHVLLGVTIAQDTQHDTTQLQQIAAPAFGIEQHRVKQSDFNKYAGKALKLGKALRRSRLRAKLATAETLSWMIAREQYRSLGTVPRHGAITGANMATLTRGRVVPYADHVRIYDAHGDVVAYTSVLAISDFPEEMDVPGEGEWLRYLSEITRIDESDTEEAGTEQAVTVEASVRFRVLSRNGSLKVAKDTRGLAAEQRRSASKRSVGEPSDAILESEAIAEALETEISRAGVVLVRNHPRLIVTGSTREELDANVSATIGYYADRGITVSIGTDEQRELWLESLPGDQLRVEDLGHIMDGHGFFGSLFWGGSALSETEGGVIGHLTGSTAGLVHIDVTAFAERDKPTTVGIFGRSGKGKTTLMQLLLLEAVLNGAWGLMLDWKGDSAGVVTAARHLGLPSQLMQITGQHSGAIDLFRALPLSDAPIQVARQLSLLASRQYADIAEDATLAAANAVAAEAHPSSWKVVHKLMTATDERVRQLGASLLELSKTELGRVLIGEPTSPSVLTTDPGLWVLQMPGLALPPAENDPAGWDSLQRVSIAAMRAVTTHALHVSSSHALRDRRKVIAVPEAHRSLKTPDGRDWLDQTARMGRAFGTALLLDSQDVEGIASMEGLVEQLIAVFGFQLVSSKQQDALAEILGLPIDDWTRGIIRNLSVTESGEEEKGHCIYLDPAGDVARMVVTLPSEEIQDLLDTNPTRATGRRAADEEATRIEGDAA